MKFFSALLFQMGFSIFLKWAVLIMQNTFNNVFRPMHQNPFQIWILFSTIVKLCDKRLISKHTKEHRGTRWGVEGGMGWTPVAQSLTWLYWETMCPMGWVVPFALSHCSPSHLTAGGASLPRGMGCIRECRGRACENCVRFTGYLEEELKAVSLLYFCKAWKVFLKWHSCLIFKCNGSVVQWEERERKRFVCFWRAKGFSDNEHFQCIGICVGNFANTLQTVGRTEVIFLSLPSCKYEKHHISLRLRKRKTSHYKSTKLKRMGKGRNWICMLWTQGTVPWPVFYDSAIALQIFHSNKREQTTVLREQR